MPRYVFLLADVNLAHLFSSSSEPKSLQTCLLSLYIFLALFSQLSVAQGVQRPLEAGRFPRILRTFGPDTGGHAPHRRRPGGLSGRELGRGTAPALAEAFPQSYHRGEPVTRRCASNGPAAPGRGAGPARSTCGQDRCLWSLLPVLAGLCFPTRHCFTGKRKSECRR